MKHLLIRPSLALALVLATGPGVLADESVSILQGEEIEAFLKNAAVVEVQEIGRGITNPLKVTLDLNGVRRYGVFKDVNRSEPGAKAIGRRWEFGFQDSYKTEIAAYEIDKMLGLGMVPATVERVIDNRRGSLQLWVDVLMSEEERLKSRTTPPDALAWSRMTTDYALFDNLIDNTDRHLNNLLITSEWKIALIDHSRSFRRNKELRKPSSLSRFSESLLDAISRLDRDMLEDRVGRYLTRVQIKGLLERRDRILGLSRKHVLERGAPAVLYR